MESIKLTEQLSLSRIVQGYWRLDGWKFSTKDLVKFMYECIDRGVTTFDTAEIYADTLCETLMGDAFRLEPAILNKIELVTKTGIFKEKIGKETFGYYNTSYNRIKKSCKESLQRLGAEQIDLYLIHREDPCFEPWETGRALMDLKQEGLIKEFGVSNFDPFKLDALNKTTEGKVVTNQIEWNPTCFEHFDSGMMDYLTVNKIHPMIWSPLAGGAIFGDNPCSKKAMIKITEIANRHNVEAETIIYAWIMYHPVGAIPLVGSSKLQRLEAAIKALDVTLEHYEWYEIYAASGQQKIR